MHKTRTYYVKCFLDFFLWNNKSLVKLAQDFNFSQFLEKTAKGQIGRVFAGDTLRSAYSLSRPKGDYNRGPLLCRIVWRFAWWWWLKKWDHSLRAVRRSCCSLRPTQEIEFREFLQYIRTGGFDFAGFPTLYAMLTLDCSQSGLPPCCCFLQVEGDNLHIKCTDSESPNGRDLSVCHFTDSPSWLTDEKLCPANCSHESAYVNSAKKANKQ